MNSIDYWFKKAKEIQIRMITQPFDTDLQREWDWIIQNINRTALALSPEERNQAIERLFLIWGRKE